MAADLDDRLSVIDDDEDFFEELRLFRAEETLRIGFWDLSSDISIEDLTTQLSALAEVCLQAALGWALEKTRERYGTPLDGQGGEARFTILGMGKLGGREIQYSSDLDLIFLYDPPGRTNGTRDTSNGEFFVRTVQRLISALTTMTASGIVYPIDARLRPSGQSGPLVTSLEAFHRYHEDDRGAGRGAALWERQALIKARPAAGDRELGREALEVRDIAAYGVGLAPGELDEIRRIRSRMEEELGQAPPGRRNLKQGPGGLVDVEFAVQSLQLRFGRDCPEVRREDTLGALDGLEASGHLDPEDARRLRDGYRFLRHVERRIRIADDRSTDLFPTEGPDLERLASRLARDPQTRDVGPEDLLRRFEQTTRDIREAYDRTTGAAI